MRCGEPRVATNPFRLSKQQKVKIFIFNADLNSVTTLPYIVDKPREVRNERHGASVIEVDVDRLISQTDDAVCPLIGTKLCLIMI